MNILIDTPLLKSAPLKKNFDNKVLVVFLGIIFSLVILGLVFIDITRGFFPSSRINQESPVIPSKVSLYA